MKIVLSTTHLGPIGGGENYLMRLAMALDDISDFYINHNFHPKFEENNGFGRKFKEYNGLFKPDVFLYCSHFNRHYPVGKRNFSVCFFPKRELRPEGFDGVIAICDYSAKYATDYWGPRSTTILYPCIGPSLYNNIGEKTKQIISIGHFFQEEEGHSKNQHILAQAFTPRLAEEGYSLLLIGNANPGDEPYVRKVRKFAEGKPIRIEVNKDNRFLKSELARSSYLWHANGYGRTDPSQAEHFGIIVLEAIASGVVPIVHNSGGAREIAGITWNEPSDLEQLTLGGVGLPKLEEKYTVEYFNKEVKKWLEHLTSDVATTTVKAPTK